MEHDKSYETILSDHDTTSAHQNHKRFLPLRYIDHLIESPQSPCCVNSRFLYPFNAWCSLKGHTYLSKPAVETCSFSA